MTALKPSVILKQVNEESTFAIDCELDDDYFFKFEGPSKLFLEALNEGKSKDQIIQDTAAKFGDVDVSQIEADYDDFIKTLKEFGLSQG